MRFVGRRSNLCTRNTISVYRIKIERERSKSPKRKNIRWLRAWCSVFIPVYVLEGIVGAFDIVISWVIERQIEPGSLIESVEAFGFWGLSYNLVNEQK